MPAHRADGRPPSSKRGLLAGFALVSLIAAVFAGTALLARGDREILAAQFLFLRSFLPRDVDKDVVIVGIDEETVAKLPEPIALWHPHFARFLHATAEGGAAAVGLDVVFPDRSYDAIAPGSDRQLLVGLIAARRAAPLIIARTVGPDDRPRPVFPVFLTAAGPDSAAFALLPTDSDKAVRRFHERLAADGGRVATLAGALARRLGASVGSGLIDFSRGSRFEPVPLHQVLAWHAAGDTASLRRVFAGKPVLLGGVFKFEDHLAAPVNLSAIDPHNVTMPGVMLHAQVVRNLLNHHLIAIAPTWTLLLICLVLACAWWWATTGLRALLAVIAGSLVILGGSTALLAAGWYAPPSAALATLFVAAVARSTREAAAGMRERRQLRRAFSGYVSPGVMDDILAGQISGELGGVNRFVCALFSDIRGYTARSEGMSPEELVAFLNGYFEELVNLIHAHGGMVTAFMGDGIMAIFGAPKALDNPSASAFQAARDILAYMKQFNARSIAAGEPPVEIGIGLHAGDVVVGHVGSSSRHDYTAIGDVVNVASRLEGTTKDVGYRLVYSKIVADALPADVDHSHLGFQQLKGHTPVEAFGFDPLE